jgi:hypothetical protein
MEGYLWMIDCEKLICKLWGRGQFSYLKFLTMQYNGVVMFDLFGEWFP